MKPTFWAWIGGLSAAVGSFATVVHGQQLDLPRRLAPVVVGVESPTSPTVSTRPVPTRTSSQSPASNPSDAYNPNAYNPGGYNPGAYNDPAPRTASLPFRWSKPEPSPANPFDQPRSSNASGVFVNPNAGGGSTGSNSSSGNTTATPSGFGGLFHRKDAYNGNYSAAMPEVWPPPEYSGPMVELPDSPFAQPYASTPQAWEWHCLPDGLMFPAYLAGGRESRMAAELTNERDFGWLLDATLGGRVGLARYGNSDVLRPQGWQLDLEAAAFVRLDMETEQDLVSSDFRAGIPLTYAEGPWEFKFAYYHLSSHLGDEFLLRTGATPDPYSRDALVLAAALRPHDDVRLYVEAGWAFFTNGGSEPWEFQMGFEYSPRGVGGGWGTPFAAVNGHLREEVDFSGNLTAQVGWQWRGSLDEHLFRIGLQYFNGKSDAMQFFAQHEQRIGLGLWYDY